MSVDFAERPFALADRRAIATMAAAVAALHALGLLGLWWFGAPVAMGLLAYLFGLRHAFDLDHIAAIDNATRKLVADRRRTGGGHIHPHGVGFWFALGHSSVVFALTFLLAIATRHVAGPLQDERSTLHTITGLLGPGISGAFLLLLGLANLGALRMAVATGGTGGPRGPLSSVLRPLTSKVSSARRIYPVGLLFGLGFDTATEVGLLVLAGGAATMDLPFYAVLALPVLFAAGMCLMDMIDGVAMAVTYDWAIARPERRARYNLVITGLSAAFALIVGVMQIASIVRGWA